MSSNLMTAKVNLMTAKVITITPSMAAEWLKDAAPNRSISEKAVSKYARDMQNGRWFTTNNGIAFNSKGQLIDGEHRLRAIVKAGVSIDSAVHHNMSEEARRVIDCGVQRDIPGQWKIHGDFPELSSKLNELASYSRAMITGGVTLRSPALSYDELTSFVGRKYDPLKFSLDNLVVGTAKDRRGTAVASVGGLIARAWYHVDHDVLAEFCYSLRTGLGVAANQNAVMILRDYLKSDATSTGGSTRMDTYQRAQSALSAYAKNQKLRVLKATRKELYPITDELI